MTNYPAQIDTTTSLPTVVDNSTAAAGVIINRLRDAILAIEDELGVKPSGIYGTVRSRLDTLEITINNLQIIKLAGDLGGTTSSPTVIGIQGLPVSSSHPNLNDALIWDGIAWIPAPGVASNLQSGGIAFLSVGNGLIYASTSVAISTGTTTLTQPQYKFPRIILTGSLSGNVTVVFPAQDGAEWLIDATGVTLNGFTITAQANSANWSTTIGVTNLYFVCYESSTGKLYGTTLTP